MLVWATLYTMLGIVRGWGGGGRGVGTTVAKCHKIQRGNVY